MKLSMGILAAALALTGPSHGQTTCPSREEVYHPLFAGMHEYRKMEREAQSDRERMSKYPDTLDRSDQELVRLFVAGEGNTTEAEQILLQRGTGPYPEMIAALPKASVRDEYIFLIRALSRCATPERDAAFQAEVENYLTRGYGFLNQLYIPIMLTALGETPNEKSMVLFEKIRTRQSANHQLRTAATIALGMNDMYPEKLSGEQSMLMHSTFNPESIVENASTALEILRELDRNFFFHDGSIYGPFELAEFRERSTGLPACKGYMGGGRGVWTLEFGRSDGDLQPFEFEFICGSLCGEGSIGVLEKKNGSWRLVYYEHRWVS